MKTLTYGIVYPIGIIAVFCGLVFLEHHKKEPFDIPSQHVEDMVDSLARIMGDGTRESLERRLKSFGSNMEELKAKAREKIATDVLIYRNCILPVQISPKEVFLAYEANPARWKKQEQLEIQLLQVLKKRTGDGADPKKIVENLKDMLKDADEEMFGEIVRKLPKVYKRHILVFVGNTSARQAP